MSGSFGRLSWRSLIPVAILVATLGILFLTIKPASVARALSTFDLSLIPIILVLSRLYLGIQAIRWYFLMRAVGAPLTAWDAQLITLAGQIADLLPLGQYARALLASKATGAHVGSVTATLVVQELTYTLVLLAIAVPGSFSHPAVVGTLLSSLVITVLLVLLLTVPLVYQVVTSLLVRIPLGYKVVPLLGDLHVSTSLLLRRRSTLLGTGFTVLYALVYVALLWLVAQGVHAGELSWQDAAFVCAVSHLAGAATALPGGLGAYEAGLVVLLIAVGMHPVPAAATAILFSAVDRGVAMLMGVIPYVVFQRRFGRHVSPMPAEP
jgi:uncharacterized membrane protein YbhN (UPF0104 family)